MPRAFLQTVVVGGLLVVATPVMAQSAAEPEPAQGFMQRVEYHISQSPSLARFLANECVLASVAAVVVSVTMTGPVTPAVNAALGVSPGLSTLGIGGLACGAGVAAGAAAAALVTAWGERGAIQEAATTQVSWIWNGVTGGVGWPVGLPVGLPEELPGGWAIASLWERAGQAISAAVQTVASAAPTGWFLREVPVPDAVKPAEYEIAIVLRRQ